jgi:hypothetical protein
VIGGTLAGPLNSSNALAVRLSGATVTGPVTIQGSSGAVVVGGIGCTGDSIAGPVRLISNGGGVTLSQNTITGPVTIANNTSLLELLDHAIIVPVGSSAQDRTCATGPGSGTSNSPASTCSRLSVPSRSAAWSRAT